MDGSPRNAVVVGGDAFCCGRQNFVNAPHCVGGLLVGSNAERSAWLQPTSAVCTDGRGDSARLGRLTNVNFRPG